VVTAVTKSGFFLNSIQFKKTDLVTHPICKYPDACCHGTEELLDTYPKGWTDWTLIPQQIIHRPLRPHPPSSRVPLSTRVNACFSNRDRLAKRFHARDPEARLPGADIEPAWDSNRFPGRRDSVRQSNHCQHRWPLCPYHVRQVDGPKGEKGELLEGRGEDD